VVGLALNRTLLAVRRRVLFWDRPGGADAGGAADGDPASAKATSQKAVTT
jgi:hypothetical protein